MNLSQAVWSFLIHTGHGMELTNQHVNADTNKSTANVIKLVDYVINHGHTLQIRQFL
jgi:hypothetical protein